MLAEGGETGIERYLEIPEGRRAVLREVAETALRARRVVLTTHVNADADGVGSEVALAAWLESHGVDVAIVNPTPFPEHLRFLVHRPGLIVDREDPEFDEVVERADLLIVVDTSEPRRIAPLDQTFAGLDTRVIDHHQPGPRVVPGGGLLDPSASAAGELIYDLITLTGDPWPAASVLGVYVAIVSDTGSFRFSNTTPRAHVIAAEMLVRGVDAEFVYERLFATAPRRRLELLREALGHLQQDTEHGIAWIAIPRSITDRLGSTPDDYDGLIEHVRALEGTRVAILFRETGASETKVSFRSTGSMDVNAVARVFDGGGHVKASGATVPWPVDEAVERVVEVVRGEVRGKR